jgi:5-methylcytosine-specific restriction endonuclease McrA
MAYDNDTLNRIYDRTDGYCHLCCKKLSFINYAHHGAKGAWEVEHSRPRSRGGTDHLNNLFAACISCNRYKAAQSSRSVRHSYGRRRAPFSKKRKEEVRNSNTAAGGFIGGLIGAIAGPWGAAFGATVGARLGRSINPND